MLAKALAVVALAAVAVAASTAPPARGASTLPSTAQLRTLRAQLLSTAEQGVATVSRLTWNAKAGWYNDFLYNGAGHMPLARLWSAFPLFETLAGIAAADPTAANRTALRQFADKAAQLYWNPKLKPVGGYEWYPGLRSARSTAYFDDSGWWGLAFVDAYRVTRDAAYLADAHRAFVFIVGAGWDPRRGGVWWETQHRHKTAEPLAAAVLIGTWLYKTRHKAWYLQQTQKLLRWADARAFDRKRGLYTRSATDATAMDYVQGLMIAAHAELCHVLHRPALCAKARSLMTASLHAFGDDLAWAPQYDVVYLRWLLDYYARSGDTRAYALAVHNAQRALAHARDARGNWVNDWNGRWIADGLEEDAATLELFAWTAAAPLPSG